MLGTTISVSAAGGMHKEPSRSVYGTSNLYILSSVLHSPVVNKCRRFEVVLVVYFLPSLLMGEGDRTPCSIPYCCLNVKDIGRINAIA